MSSIVLEAVANHRLQILPMDTDLSIDVYPLGFHIRPLICWTVIMCGEASLVNFTPHQVRSVHAAYFIEVTKGFGATAFP